MAEKKKGEDTSGGFIDLVESLGFGTLVQKLDAKLIEVSEAVQETGKVGEITLKLKLKKSGEFAAVVADVRVNRPEHPTPETSFFFGAKGLQRDDPKQLHLKNLPATPARLRTIDGGKDDE